MINKRKKKPIDIQDTFYDLTYRKKDSTSSLGSYESDTSDENVLTLRNLRGTIGKEYRESVAKAQNKFDSRQEAEESNLDILDRGSRYTRKSKKLKKFKV